jgi:hypothetical protein
VPVHALSVPARSVTVTVELPCQRPASPEMKESPSETIAGGPLVGVAAAGAADTALTAKNAKRTLRSTGDSYHVGRRGARMGYQTGVAEPALTAKIDAPC